MIQESKHYMDRQKVHKSSATSLDLEPDTKKHTTRPDLPRAILATYFTEADHVARFLLEP
jgi:hypothetical protein